MHSARPHRPSHTVVRCLQRCPRRLVCRAAIANGDVAAVAVETVAAAALRSRLRAYSSVAVHVSATAWDLLSGRIDGAKVEGRGWQSPQGLTARVLDVQVGRVELDLPSALAQQRIVLKNTPTGSAQVVFNARDFGAFLQHPLVLTAARRAVRGLPFLFDRAGVEILPGGPESPSGFVLFTGASSATGQRYQLLMRPTRGGRAAAVAATPVGPVAATSSDSSERQRQPWPQHQPLASTQAGARGAAVSVLPGTQPHTGSEAGASSVMTAGSGDEDQEVSAELSRFFSSLTVDLQGAELAFKAMRVSRAAGAGPAGGRRGTLGAGPRPAQQVGEPLLELDLVATVRSFPPLNVQF